MKIIFIFLLCLGSVAHAATLGWISDSKCGARHTGTGGACAKKCIAGGMSPVFVDTRKRVWTISNPATVRDFYGSHVRVTATLNAAQQTITIKTIREANPKEKSLKNPGWRP